MGEFDVPEGLCENGQMAARAIIDRLKADGCMSSGGCKVFYSPQSWKERGEKYGLKSVLVVVHDGGDHAGYFNLSYDAHQCIDSMQSDLRKIGLYAEQCTSWYSAIYSVRADLI